MQIYICIYKYTDEVLFIYIFIDVAYIYIYVYI